MRCNRFKLRIAHFSYDSQFIEMHRMLFLRETHPILEQMLVVCLNNDLHLPVFCFLCCVSHVGGSLFV